MASICQFSRKTRIIRAIISVHLEVPVSSKTCTESASCRLQTRLELPESGHISGHHFNETRYNMLPPNFSLMSAASMSHHEIRASFGNRDTAAAAARVFEGGKFSSRALNLNP